MGACECVEMKHSGEARGGVRAEGTEGMSGGKELKVLEQRRGRAVNRMDGGRKGFLNVIQRRMLFIWLFCESGKKIQGHYFDCFWGLSKSRKWG